MKNSPIQQISELTKIYGISEIEIIDLLRKAVTKSSPHKEIEVEVSNQKLIFYKTFYNRYNELKKEQIKLKVEDKNKINKIFYKLLFKESQLRIFKNIKDFQKSNNGVISGEVIGKVANGFKVLTKFGTAYLPFSAIPIAEKNKMKIDDVEGIDFLLKKLEYGAFSDNGIFASDFGMPLKIIEYYENNELNKKKAIEIKENFDKFEEIKFKEIEEIINKNQEQ